MNPKRLEDIEDMLDGPDFLDFKPVVRELVVAYREALDKYLDTLELLTEVGKVRDEYKRQLDFAQRRGPRDA